MLEKSWPKNQNRLFQATVSMKHKMRLYGKGMFFLVSPIDDLASSYEPMYFNWISIFQDYRRSKQNDKFSWMILYTGKHGCYIVQNRCRSQGNFNNRTDPRMFLQGFNIGRILPWRRHRGSSNFNFFLVHLNITLIIHKTHFLHFITHSQLNRCKGLKLEWQQHLLNCCSVCSNNFTLHSEPE